MTLKEPSTLVESESKIAKLLRSAAEGIDRRGAQRHPFFRPVVVTVLGSIKQDIEAFSREISSTGMGLLHHLPLTAKTVVLSIPDDGAEDVLLAGEVIWCRPCGKGWFLSGVRFTDGE